ncbi:DUF445 domain-containing protein [Paenibacillus segetis]|uniref:DUF445 domain-containing protein n=1 Tax=Paenibacillus segetis TaxID=1325360 RepID=A0ABQ1Y5D2_9BACL|nr:DUF445 domain-containing protein [Paenibacillus segetis]GGH12009.1 hypothetical protein GCM10008013_04170 [Paenibacillus segetis]
MNTTKKKSNRMAEISLGVMGAGFVATLPFSGTGLALLQGGFEAGLVGGLADWFAVTALFRHPLRIPIPHTALLPKNRDKMTKAITTMVETELLNQESIRAKIKQIRITDIALQKLKESVESESFQRGIAGVLETAVRSLPTDTVIEYAKRMLVRYLDRLDEGALLDKLIKGIISHDYDEKALDFALERAEQWVKLDSTKDFLGKMAMQRISELEVNGLMKFALGAFMGYLNEEKLGSVLQTFILDKISDLQIPDHQDRYKLLFFFQKELLSLSKSPSLLNELSRLKHVLVEKGAESDKINAMTERALEHLAVYIGSDEFRTELLVPFMEKMVAEIDRRPELVDRAENWIQEQIVSLMEKHYSKIGELVEENLNKLDNDSLIEFIEDKVGHDLQWIRVNGAVCGFIVGLVLTGCKLLLT